MGRRPLDVEPIITQLIKSDDLALKKTLAKKIQPGHRDRPPLPDQSWGGSFSSHDGKHDLLPGP